MMTKSSAQILADHIFLETPRLTLRPPIESDFEAWSQCMADERAMEFVGGIRDRSAAWKSLAMAAGSWSLRGYGQFSVIEKASGQWIGRTGPAHPEGWPWPEVGWIVVPSRWGNGFATEAVKAALSWTFDVLSWEKVYHLIDPRNITSINLAGRIGSSKRNSVYLPAPRENEQLDVWMQTDLEWKIFRPTEKLCDPSEARCSGLSTEC